MGVRAWLTVAILGTTAIVTPACAPLVVGGAAVTAVASTGDPRSTGTQVDDQVVELKVYEIVNRDPALTSPDRPSPLDPSAPTPPPLSRVAVTSYNGVVLLTGEVPTEAARADLVARVRAVDKVRQVQDELVVGPPASNDAQGADSLLTTRVRTRMLLEKDFDSDAVKVVSSAGTVYLIGLVTRKQAGIATEIARTTSGARRVVKLFEYFD